MSDKKIVHFRLEDGVFFIPYYGKALLTPVDHPDTVRVSNTRQVQTSDVLRVRVAGQDYTFGQAVDLVQNSVHSGVEWATRAGVEEVETKHTIYRPFVDGMMSIPLVWD